MATTIYNVHDKIRTNELPTNKFVVVYGNEYHGDVFDTKKDLIKGYKRILRYAFHQDVTLFYNGRLIRGIRNFNQKVTTKNIQYIQVITKY